MQEVINMLRNISILTSHPWWVLKVNYERAGFLALVHHSPYVFPDKINIVFSKREVSLNLTRSRQCTRE